MDEYFAKLKELSRNMEAKIQFYVINGRNNWISLKN